jgi:hypothetical protein
MSRDVRRDGATDGAEVLPARDSAVASMQHPILTGHDGGAGHNDDALAWEKLAATAGECLSLELSLDAYEALVRLEASYRRAAALPVRSRRRFHSA